MHVLESDFFGAGPDFAAGLATTITIDLDRISQWAVYRRLQELNLVCDCGCDRPLTVTIATPTAALQVWSVVQATTGAKAALTDHLARCWQHRIPQ
jgi:hypothetical protein